MIREIGVEIGAKLAAQGCTFKVYDRDLTDTTAPIKERVVIERDYEAGESFAAPPSQKLNPTMPLARNMAAKIRIYAKSPKANALQWEHERHLDAMLDQVLVALNDVIVARKNSYQIGRGKFFLLADAKSSEQIAGAVYELPFTVSRGIYRTTWKGEATPEVEITEGMIRSRTNVSLANGPDVDPDTSCGG